MARRLVQFWAGGRVKKEKKAEERREARREGDNKVNESAAVEKAEKFKRGGKFKVKVVNKAKGGRMPKMMAPPPAMPMADPMEGRMDTGIVARKPPGRRALPALGGMLGPLR